MAKPYIKKVAHKQDQIPDHQAVTFHDTSQENAIHVFYISNAFFQLSLSVA